MAIKSEIEEWRPIKGEVWIKLKYYGKFKTLEEAISRRDSVLHQLGYDFALGRTLNGNI